MLTIPVRRSLEVRLSPFTGTMCMCIERCKYAIYSNPQKDTVTVPWFLICLGLYSPEISACSNSNFAASFPRRMLSACDWFFESCPALPSGRNTRTIGITCQPQLSQFRHVCPCDKSELPMFLKLNSADFTLRNMGKPWFPADFPHQSTEEFISCCLLHGFCTGAIRQTALP